MHWFNDLLDRSLERIKLVLTGRVISSIYAGYHNYVCYCLVSSQEYDKITDFTPYIEGLTAQGIKPHYLAHVLMYLKRIRPQDYGSAAESIDRLRRGVIANTAPALKYSIAEVCEKIDAYLEGINYVEGACTPDSAVLNAVRKCKSDSPEIWFYLGEGIKSDALIFKPGFGIYSFEFKKKGQYQLRNGVSPLALLLFWG